MCLITFFSFNIFFLFQYVCSSNIIISILYSYRMNYKKTKMMMVLVMHVTTVPTCTILIKRTLTITCWETPVTTVLTGIRMVFLMWRIIVRMLTMQSNLIQIWMVWEMNVMMILMEMEFPMSLITAHLFLIRIRLYFNSMI